MDVASGASLISKHSQPGSQLQLKSFHYPHCVCLCTAEADAMLLLLVTHALHFYRLSTPPPRLADWGKDSGEEIQYLTKQTEDHKITVIRKNIHNFTYPSGKCIGPHFLFKEQTENIFKLFKAMINCHRAIFTCMQS